MEYGILYRDLVWTASKATMQQDGEIHDRISVGRFNAKGEA